MTIAPDPTRPRIDLHVKLANGAVQLLVGTPTEGATFSNLAGAPPFPEGVAKEDVTIVLVPAGMPHPHPRSAADEMSWIEWHAIGQREPYRLYADSEPDLMWQAQLALGDSDAAISHARTAYVLGEIEIDEFERRLDSILLAA